VPLSPITSSVVNKRIVRVRDALSWSRSYVGCLRHIRTPCLTGIHFGGCDGRYFSSSDEKQERNTEQCGSLSGAVYELQHCPFREGCFTCIHWTSTKSDVELTMNYQCTCASRNNIDITGQELIDCSIVLTMDDFYSFRSCV
jgi:hypothetical protein